MPDARHYTRGRYLAAADIGEQRRTARIRKAQSEEVGRDREDRLVLHLKSLSEQNWPRGIVLNTGNINTLVDAFGSDYSKWADHGVEVYTEATHYAGKPTRGIRVRPADTSTTSPFNGEADDDEPGDGSSKADDDLDDVVPW